MSGGWWRGARLRLGNQVDGELTTGSINIAYYTGNFVYTILESTSYRQVNLDGLNSMLQLWGPRFTSLMILEPFSQLDPY